MSPPRAVAFTVALTAFAIASAPGVGRAQEPGCGKDTDCKFERICRSGTCVDPRPMPPEGPPLPAPRDRPPWRAQQFGIYYLGVVPIGGDNQPPQMAHSIGIESTSRIFSELRFHFALGYQGQPTAADTQHGIRSEVIGLGYIITALDDSGVQLGIEPVLYLFNLETYFPSTTHGAQFDLGSGWGVRGVFGFADRHGYVALEPIGMDLRWLQAGDGIPTVAGLGASWRIRASAGIAF